MLNGSGLPTPFLITSVWRNSLVGCYSEAKIYVKYSDNFFHHNSLYFNNLQTYFYFNDLQEKQQNQLVINKGYFAVIFNKPMEALEKLCPKSLK
jgi:hypothetical protein